MKTALAFVLVGITIVACGGDDDDEGAGAPTGATKDYVAIDSEKFCTAISSCTTSYPKEECLGAYGALRVPPACKSSFESATCTTKETDLFPASCFAPCTEGTATCDGGTLTRCGSGRSLTIDCAAGCATQNKTFVRCGTNPGETENKCLCQ